MKKKPPKIRPNPQTEPPSVSGWHCPTCGGSHAPWVATCPYATPPVVTLPSIPMEPTKPFWYSPDYRWVVNSWNQNSTEHKS
jgi:hypothetical protein